MDNRLLLDVRAAMKGRYVDLIPAPIRHGLLRDPVRKLRFILCDLWDNSVQSCATPMNFHASMTGRLRARTLVVHR